MPLNIHTCFIQYYTCTNRHFHYVGKEEEEENSSQTGDCLTRIPNVIAHMQTLEIANLVTELIVVMHCNVVSTCCIAFNMFKQLSRAL